jgi:hypothetical protein
MNVCTILSKDIYSTINVKDNVTTPIADVICDNFNEEEICTNGNYVQKYITKLYNYQPNLLLVSPYRRDACTSIFFPLIS